jgi:alpha-tubulin suppressor-like RCC1 family protein
MTADGIVYVCGRNQFGQLGLPYVTAKDYSKDPTGKTLCLKRNNMKVPTKLPLPAPAQMLAAMNFSTLILLTNGVLLSFGTNEEGEVGRAASTDPAAETKDAVEMTDYYTVKVGDDSASSPVVSIATGYKHSAAVTADGSLWMWGNLHYYKIDRVMELSGVSQSPKRIIGFGGGVGEERATQVKCGECFTMVLTSNGQLWSMGHNYHGKLGQGMFNSDKAGEETATSFNPIPAKIMDGIPSDASFQCGTNHTILSFRV